MAWYENTTFLTRKFTTLTLHTATASTRTEPLAAGRFIHELPARSIISGRAFNPLKINVCELFQARLVSIASHVSPSPPLAAGNSFRFANSRCEGLQGLPRATLRPEHFWQQPGLKG